MVDPSKLKTVFLVTIVTTLLFVGVTVITSIQNTEPNVVHVWFKPDFSQTIQEHELQPNHASFLTASGSIENASFDSNPSRGILQSGTSHESYYLTNNLYRIQFVVNGRCVGISQDNSLTVSFCDPTAKQAFSFSNGMLRSEDNRLCVGIRNLSSTELGLVDCNQAIRLTLVGNKLREYSSAGSEIRCLAPNKPRTELGMPVALAGCKHSSSDVKLLDETGFLRDRAALTMPLTDETSCNLTACRANHRPPMAKLLPESEVNRCENLSKCLTVVVKTARRPFLVIRLATSIRDRLDQDLPMIVIDDGPMPHPPEIMAQLAQFPNIKYIVSDRSDLGISEGRMIGVKMVTTKYFVNMDDDNVVTKSWDVAKMTELLDTTDLTLVGGRTDSTSWPSFLEFEYGKKGEPVLLHYMGTCKKANQGLPFFPDCVRCDLTSNSFIAKTKEILEVGGWSLELKVNEHQDLFLRLRAAGKKVVWCPKFRVLNKHPVRSETEESDYNSAAYRRLRYKRGVRMTKLFCNHWNVARYVHQRGVALANASWLNDL